MNIGERAEGFFENWGSTIYRFRWIVLIGMLLTVFGFITQLPKTTVDTSNEGFLHEGDPILEQYNKFRDQYGREETIVLAIQTEDIFTFETLEKLRDLHVELERNVPYLSEVSSLINARNTRGEGDVLIVEDLLERWPTTQADLDKIRRDAFNNDIYQNILMSEDGKIAVLLIESVVYVSDSDEGDELDGFDDQTSDSSEQAPRYMSEVENSEMVIATQKIIEKYNSDNFKIISAGTPIVIENLKNAMQADMQGFTKNSFLLILAVLGIMFRRVSGVILPIVIVIVSIISAFGAMAASGTPLKMPTQILPSFILAVSVAASVHLLVKFYKVYDESHNKKEAVAKALAHSGMAIVMTSLTTSAGLFSFAGSKILPISDLGVFAGASVFLVLIYNLVFLPALLSVVPIFKKKKKKVDKKSIIDGFLLSIASFSIRNAKVIGVSAVSLLFVCIALASQVSFKHDPLTWMPSDWETVQATRFVDDYLKGSTTTEVVVETKKENGVYNPGLLAAIDELQYSLVEHNYSVEGASVGKAYSVVDIVKETNRALHGNHPDEYLVPKERDLIAQELLLFEDAGSDDLQDFVDTTFSQARMSLKTPWIDAGASAKFLAEIDQKIQSVTAADPDAEAYITGMGPLFVRTLSAAIDSMRDSYLIAFLVISIMMCALLGSIKLGVVSILPNILPIAVALAILSMLGIPLDLFTMLVGSISIGLAVDDTIHFMHNFKRDYEKTGDLNLAVNRTFLVTGRAILVTTVVLCVGFFVFMGATMHNVVIFGALIGSTILFALIADLLIMPALMVLVYGNKSQKAPSEELATGAPRLQPEA